MLSPRIASLLGLSPRMRGNPKEVCPLCLAHRSIPAHAGQPATAVSGNIQTKVYPRACGATISSAFRGSRSCGLSPRMRGNHARLASSGAFCGSIPAHAGQPSRQSSSYALKPVYPRACGATSRLLYRNDVILGLSPRMRGNLATASAFTTTNRSIPAHAGQPSFANFSHFLPTVYPRACGATQCNCTKAVLCVGLSPRMRGNR